MAMFSVVRPPIAQSAHDGAVGFLRYMTTSTVITMSTTSLTLILETAVQGMTLNLTDGPARGLSLL